MCIQLDIFQFSYVKYCHICVLFYYITVVTHLANFRDYSSVIANYKLLILEITVMHKIIKILLL